MVGYANMSQGTIGAQIGGMSWSEVLFFENRWAFDKFKSNQLAASANASFAGPKHGGTNTLNYADGVMIFTMDTRGFAVAAAAGSDSVAAADSATAVAAAAFSALDQTTEQRAKTKWLGVAMAAAATRSSLYRSCRRPGPVARVAAEATALHIASQNQAKSPDSHRPSV